MVRKILIAISVLFLLMALFLFVVMRDIEYMPLTEIEETSKVLYEEMQKDIVESDKIVSFVEDRLPYGFDSIYSLEIGDEEVLPSREDLHRETLDNFNLAIEHDDIDLFLNVITSESIEEILDGEENIEKRLNIFSETIKKLNRNGLFEKAPYQFHVEKRNNEANSGVMNFMYNDGKEVEVPFELELVGEGEHSFYVFTTSIVEMISLINSAI